MGYAIESLGGPTKFVEHIIRTRPAESHAHVGANWISSGHGLFGLPGLPSGNRGNQVSRVGSKIDRRV
eukprot:11158378-Lingulodinium_polyedra.AAC.1